VVEGCEESNVCLGGIDGRFTPDSLVSYIRQSD